MTLDRLNSLAQGSFQSTPSLSHLDRLEVRPRPCPPDAR